MIDRAVMKKYYLPDIAIAVLISQYYPLDNFLGDDGNEIMQLAGSRKSDHKTLKPLSLRRFRKALGVAPVSESSGKSVTRTKKAGSSLCRVQFWLWSFSTFEKKSGKLKSATPVMNELNDLWLGITPGKHIKVRCSTFASKVVERLFYDLIAARSQ